MPQIVSEKRGNTTYIEIAGNLDVKNSGKIKELLSELKPDTEEIHVVQQDTDNLDISYLQLLFAWIKKMTETGKKMKFEHRLNEEYSKITKESGFIDAIENMINREHE